MWAIMNLLYYIMMLVVMVKLVSNMIKGLVVSPPPTPSTTPSKPKRGGGSTPSIQPKSGGGSSSGGGSGGGGGGGLPPGHRYLVPLRILAFKPESTMGRAGGMYHVFAKVVCPDNTVASAWLWMNYPDPKRIRCICNRSPWGLTCIGNKLEVIG